MLSRRAKVLHHQYYKLQLNVQRLFVRCNCNNIDDARNKDEHNHLNKFKSNLLKWLFATVCESYTGLALSMPR